MAEGSSLRFLRALKEGAAALSSEEERDIWFVIFPTLDGVVPADNKFVLSGISLHVLLYKSDLSKAASFISDLWRRSNDDEGANVRFLMKALSLGQDQIIVTRPSNKSDSSQRLRLYCVNFSSIAERSGIERDRKHFKRDGSNRPTWISEVIQSFQAAEDAQDSLGSLVVDTSEPIRTKVQEGPAEVSPVDGISFFANSENQSLPGTALVSPQNSIGDVLNGNRTDSGPLATENINDPLIGDDSSAELSIRDDVSAALSRFGSEGNGSDTDDSSVGNWGSTPSSGPLRRLIASPLGRLTSSARKLRHKGKKYDQAATDFDRLMNESSNGPLTPVEIRIREKLTARMSQDQRHQEAVALLLQRKGGLSPAEDKLCSRLMVRKDPGRYDKNARKLINMIGSDGQGKEKCRSYLRCPPERGLAYYSKSVREVGNVLMLAAKKAGVNCMDAIRWVSKKSPDCKNHVALFVKKRTKQERINMTLRLYKAIGAGGWRGTERGRLFFQNYVLELTQNKHGTEALPLNIKGTREYQDKLAPRDQYFHSKEYLETGKGGKKGKNQRKVKNCTFLISLNPDELIAQGMQHILQKGNYIEMNEISHGRNHFCLGVTNIDKGGDETTWFFRFGSQSNSNQPKCCIMLAQYGSNGSESIYNIKKCMVGFPGGLKKHMLDKMEEQGLTLPPHDAPPVASNQTSGQYADEYVVGGYPTIFREYTKSDLQLAKEGNIFAAEDTASLVPPIHWRRIYLRKENGNKWSILDADNPSMIIETAEDTEDEGPVAEFGSFYRLMSDAPLALEPTDGDALNVPLDAPSDVDAEPGPIMPEIRCGARFEASEDESRSAANQSSSAAQVAHRASLCVGSVVTIDNNSNHGRITEIKGGGWLAVELDGGDIVKRRRAQVQVVNNGDDGDEPPLVTRNSSIERDEREQSDGESAEWEETSSTAAVPIEAPNESTDELLDAGLQSLLDNSDPELVQGTSGDCLQNPLQEIMQNLLDDNCIVISVAFKHRSGDTLHGTALAILPSPHPQSKRLIDREDEILPENLQEMIVSDNKYLSPCIKRVYATTSNDLRLIRYQGDGIDQYIGVGAVNESGNVTAWCRFQTDGKVLSSLDYEPIAICSNFPAAGEEEDSSPTATGPETACTCSSGGCNTSGCNSHLEGGNIFLPEGIQIDPAQACRSAASGRTVPCWCKRIFVMEGSDGKMMCILIHHQGQRGKYCCPGCIAVLRSMSDLDVEAPMRDGDYADDKMFNNFINYRHPATKKKKTHKQVLQDGRRDASKNIDGPPPLRIHDYKRCESMHMLMRNLEHIDTLVIADLYEISSTSLCMDKHKALLAELEASLDQGKNLVAKFAETYEHLLKKRENSSRDLSRAEKKELSEAYTACVYANDFVAAHEQAIADTRKLIGADKKKCLLTMIFTEAYYETCSITMGKYFSGRTLTYGDSTTMLSNWTAICRYFIATVNKRANGLFKIEDLENALRKATELILPLLEIERIQQKQSKVTFEDGEKLHEHYQDLKKALQKNYPGVVPWWYVHYGVRHMSEKAKANGVIGRVNAQGAEANHALDNMLESKAWSCKAPDVKSQLIVKNLLTLNSNDVEAIEKEEERRRRKMPKRAIKRTLANIHDENATDPFHELLNEYGRADEHDEDDSICADLRNNNENRDNAGDGAVVRVGRQGWEVEEEEGEVEQQEERCSLLFGKYITRPKICEDALGDENHMVECPKCSKHVPQKSIAVHEVIIHETTDHVEKALRAVNSLKQHDPSSTASSIEEDENKSETAGHCWYDESSDEEEESILVDDDGDLDEKEIDDSDYTLDDALNMWKRSKKDYVWQKEPEGGLSAGDIFVFFFEWGWERLKVHPLSKCSNTQKVTAKSMKIPVHYYIRSDEQYDMLDLGIEGMSYLSEENFQKLLDGEDANDLGIIADQSWCVVRLGE